MNIKLNTIHIHHFRSIDDIILTLNDQGTVIVKGENYYEDRAVSNGSGKSSIFEGMIFSIYEETSSGEKDVANRVYNDGYKLTLDFNIDSNHYIIIREQKGSKSTVLLYKNEVDISARNKTDTNKLILDIFKVNKALFLDSIFLSQNISTSLSSLSPTARKERLEILTNTDANISLFKENMKAVQTKYESNANNIQLNIKQLEGKLSAMQQQSQELSLKIDQINQVNEANKSKYDKVKIEVDISNLKQKITELEQVQETNSTSISNLTEENDTYRQDKNKLDVEIDTYNTQLFKAQDNLSNINMKITTETYNINNLNSKIEHNLKEIDSISKSDTCPTCGRKYDNFDSTFTDNLIAKYNEEIYDMKNNILQLNSVVDKLNLDKIDCTSQLRDIELEINKLVARKNELDIKIKENTNKCSTCNEHILFCKSQLLQYKNQLDKLYNDLAEANNIQIIPVDEYVNMLNKINSDIINIDNEVKDMSAKLSNINSYVDICKHCLQLITKEFRTYLLKNSIQYLNTLLRDYSVKLFSNIDDVIYISEDDNKLNIYLGNASYESLSGGEKTRVNIALLLAQKSLASIIGNISCNIIILDEVLGYCDSTAELNIIELITAQLDSLETIYMISHKEIPIGYDNQIVVVKDKSGLSRLK